MPAKAKYPPAKPAPPSESSSEETISDEEEEEVDPIEIMNEMTIFQRRKVYALKGIQKEFSELQAQFLAEIAAAEVAFEAEVAPLADERLKVITGKRDVTEEEMKAYQEVKQESGVEEIPTDDEKEGEEKEGDAKKQKKSVTVVSKADEKAKDALTLAAENPAGGIPGFWATALAHNEVTEGMVTERDLPCLQSLINITKRYIDNNPRLGFIIEFHFEPNDYFTNTVLTKTYKFDQDPITLKQKEPLLETIEGCEIDWKSQDKKLTVILKQKKQRHKGGKGVRVVTKEEKCPSFFHFFEAPKAPSSDDDEEDDEDEMDYNDQMEMDYEAATMITDHVIPRAVHYYSGRSIEEIASAMDFEGMMGGMMGGDEEDEEDEDEEEEEAPKGKKGGKASKAPKGAEGKDCKQQ